MIKENNGFIIIQLSKFNDELLMSSSLKLQVYNFLRILNYEYPNFKKWYNNLFLEDGFLKDNREIFICIVNNCIVGVSIIKSEFNENKICTLRIKKEFQRNGIGRALVNKSLEYLKTDKPMITIHKSKEKQFEKLFKYYGFKKEQSVKNYYHLFNIELSYNGVLPEKKIWLNKFEPIDMEDVLFSFVSKNLYNIENLFDRVYLNNLNIYNLNKW